MFSPYPNRLQYRSQPSRAKIDECMAPSLLRFATTPGGEAPICEGDGDDLMKSYQSRINHALSVIRESGVPLARPPELTHQATQQHIEGDENSEMELEDVLEVRQQEEDVPVRMLDIFHAACDGDCKMIELNLQAGVNVNIMGQPNPTAYNGVQFEKRWTYFATPLIFAAAFGREEAVLCLLKHGADMRILSSTCLTAKDIAVQRGYQAIVNILEESGRDI
ncbi:unnamed protein product [Phytomonas sp. EM1]|nr:unnamed protein product [Phytomonas sp. EM1]|eukprot:CCW62204.1 unnamed protein product [Phytomonas sp. isolate EM1]